TSRRDAIGFIVETLGIQFSQVLNGHRAQQFRMDRRNTVSAMRTNDGKVGHPNLALRTLFHETYAPNAVLISGKTPSDLINQATIDFVDYLQVTRKHPLKPDDRPFLKRLWQQRVISIAQGPLSKVPRLIPAEMYLVEQNPHQLRHRHRWVRVIELNGNLVGERVPVCVTLAEAANKVRQRTGDEKILLNKAQSLSL